MTSLDDAIVLQPLGAEDGGGYAATVPDLPGCMSDAETPEAALADVADAVRSWIEAARDVGHAVPPPSRRIDVAALPPVRAA